MKSQLGLSRYVSCWLLSLTTTMLGIVGTPSFAQTNSAQKAKPATVAGNDSGNGGAGVNRNGRYMTFYSAGFYTEPVESQAEDVPQLRELLDFFNTTNTLTEMTKVKYAVALVPSSGRKYFRVKADTFTPVVRARLVAEYSRAMKISDQEVALFAITDISSKTTYLLPEYFQLKPNEQKAVLYHETFWLVYPNVNYQTVIESEMAFQAYLEQPQTVERLLKWISTAGTLGDTLATTMRLDVESQALAPLYVEWPSSKPKEPAIMTTRIRLPDLLGEKFMDCRSRKVGIECMSFFTTHLYSLTKMFPQSLLIKLLYDKHANEKLWISTYKFDFKKQYVNSFAINILREDSNYEYIKKLEVDLAAANFEGQPKISIDYRHASENVEYDFGINNLWLYE